ncbi:nucleoporin GLE1-like [Pomacea canaliculata]|uniref:nucleoporin GLE1-like n=1 Tax=Pomacea canaliculata TaxID=400727 RepID=UPI000D73BEB6|nr:nucleoporin GLE1-like [Pomacea canaliculata]
MAGKNGDDDEILHKLKQFKDSTQNFGDLIKKAIVTAEEKGKEAEVSRQLIQSAPQLAQPQKTAVEVQPTAADASHTEEKVLVEVTKEFEKRKELIVQINSKLEPFIKNKDQQMKKFRFELQKAVNTPVNAISPVSRAHLLDILKRLQTLLRGQVVHVSDKSISACSVPEGIDFCKNLVARMIARKAEEQVSSNHESAFAIAAIAVGLWAEFTEVGELLMSHLQELCPYVIPYYQPRLPGQSSADYHRALGYKVDEDGTIEQQDKFLKRMSGVIRLYAAILITSPPQKVPHPHGLEYAWIWLSRALNLHPNPDITATAIYDILQVTGHALLKAYRVQFVKLLYFILKSYLPKLKDVAANSGPVSRLEIFLETTMKNSGMIALPEGYIPPEFWN